MARVPLGSVVIKLTVSQGRAGVQQKEICPVQSCWEGSTGMQCRKKIRSHGWRRNESRYTCSDLVEYVERNGGGFNVGLKAEKINPPRKSETGFS